MISMNFRQWPRCYAACGAAVIVTGLTLSSCSDSGQVTVRVKNEGDATSPLLRVHVGGETTEIGPLAHGETMVVTVRVTGESNLRIDRWNGAVFVEIPSVRGVYLDNLMVGEVRVAYRAPDDVRLMEYDLKLRYGPR